MKLLKRLVIITLAILSFSMSFTVQAKTIDFKEGSIQYWDMNSGKKFAKKLGLKRKSSKDFDLYYKGNNIIIGTNKSNVSYPKKYIYVYNKGNKNLTFYGIRIGDSKSTVRKKLKKQKGSAFSTTYCFVFATSRKLRDVIMNFITLLRP